MNCLSLNGAEEELVALLMKSIQLFRLSVLISVLITISCVTEPVEDTNAARPIDENTVWQLGDFPVRPGWSQDDRDVPLALSPLPDPLPREFVLKGNLPMGNMGPQASGTAWAAGFTAFSFLVQLEKGDKEFLCSPAFLYNRLNGGKNNGIELFDALLMLRDTGCPDISLMPYRPFDFLYQPGTEAIQDAGKHRIQNFARVDFTDAEQVKGHLLQGHPVLATLRIFDNFLGLEGKNWSRPLGRPRGRHTVAVIGYSDRREEFLIQNSVGSAWGDNGRVWIPYSWFIRLTEKAYVLWL